MVLCGHKFLTPWGKYHGMQLLEHMVRLCVILKETAKPSSKLSVPISMFHLFLMLRTALESQQ